MKILDPRDSYYRFAVRFPKGGDRTVYDSAESARLALSLARGPVQRNIALGLESHCYQSGSYRTSFHNFLDRLYEHGLAHGWFVSAGLPVLVIADPKNLDMATRFARGNAPQTGI
jgi:hypothetical protein